MKIKGNYDTMSFSLNKETREELLKITQMTDIKMSKLINELIRLLNKKINNSKSFEDIISKIDKNNVLKN